MYQRLPGLYNPRVGSSRDEPMVQALTAFIGRGRVDQPVQLAQVEIEDERCSLRYLYRWDRNLRPIQSHAGEVRLFDRLPDRVPLNAASDLPMVINGHRKTADRRRKTEPEQHRDGEEKCDHHRR